MHLITIGHVVIRVSTTSGDVATLAVSGPGEAVGEQSLLSGGGSRNASAIALDRVETLYLSRRTFEELRAQHAQVDRFLISLLDTRLRKITDRLLAALYLPASVRVLRCLEDTCVTFGGDLIPLTQDDIASMAGTTRPTTNRILRHAADRGAIRLARGYVTVTDSETLRQIGQSSMGVGASSKNRTWDAITS